jgi:hypothetical protein
MKATNGPGFRGRPGYLASWRPLNRGIGTIKILGSPFKSFDKAEAACNAMLEQLFERLIQMRDAHEHFFKGRKQVLGRLPSLSRHEHLLVPRSHTSIDGSTDLCLPCRSGSRRIAVSVTIIPLTAPAARFRNGWAQTKEK